MLTSIAWGEREVEVRIMRSWRIQWWTGLPEETERKLYLEYRWEFTQERGSFHYG